MKENASEMEDEIMNAKNVMAVVSAVIAVAKIAVETFGTIKTSNKNKG